ncbi:hypothetical protein ACIQI7_10850 [Kitasatospora sp. NPDC092039]|uniref:hypothetical protein n=1 Tax=Kitasatospora sp. NPDC092039 TaxID=3364086 RepID=UPI00381B2CD1
MARTSPKGAERRVVVLRRETRNLAPSGVAVRLNVASLGSVAKDSRADRIGFVHRTTGSYAYLREPGTVDDVWECPVTSVGPPSAEEAERAQLVDVGVVPHKDHPE